MRDKHKEDKYFNNKSTVYGPVKSWRFGMSLGIDPIFEISTCSFNCFYCQLGQIQNITDQSDTFVPTEKIISDLKKLLLSNPKIDVITYSGSGEPSLAKNLKQIIEEIRKLCPNVPQYILTNATELHKENVRARLLALDKIIVKIDAADEQTFQRINRPAKGVTLERVLTGIKELKKQYSGSIEVQSMFMPFNTNQLEDYIKIINEINPDALALNTPKRPYPSEWHRENRGNHELLFDYKTTNLKILDKEQAQTIEDYIRANTKTEVYSIYR